MALCRKGGRDRRGDVGRGGVGGVVDVGEVALDLGTGLLYFPSPALVPGLDKLREQQWLEFRRHCWINLICLWPLRCPSMFAAFQPLFSAHLSYPPSNLLSKLKGEGKGNRSRLRYGEKNGEGNVVAVRKSKGYCDGWMIPGGVLW